MQTPKPSRAAAKLLAAATIALGPQLIAPDHSSGALRTWNNPAGGTFQSGGNWVGGNAPLTGDNALFNLHSGLGYSVTFNGSATNTTLNVADDKPTFALNAGTYTLSQSANVGVNSNDDARLTLNNGTLAASNVSVAANAGTSGTLALGAGAAVTCSSVITVGGQGQGTLSISGGADVFASSSSVGSAATGAGVIIVSGIGSTYQAANPLPVGSGTVQVLAGGALSDGGALLGSVANATTNVLVSGNGSSWTDSGTLALGSSPNGNANVTINAGGLLTSAGGAIGVETGSVGTITVSGAGSRWINSGSLDLRSGSLNVLNGGTVSASAVFATAGAGSIKLHGPGATLNSGTALWTGTLESPITIDAGATLLADKVALGFVPDSTDSDLTVDNLGSAMNATGAMQVASAIGSHSTLRVTNGASLVAPGVSFAVSAGSVGTAVLSGGGAQLASSGDVNIGGNSSAAGGTSLVSVEPGATLSATSGQLLRLWPAGTLRLAGGTVSTGSLSMLGGTLEWNAGTVAISGASGLHIGAGAALGDHLSIDAAKHLVVTDQLTVDLNASLTLDGGTVHASNVFNSAAGEIVLADDASAIVSPISNSGLLRGDGRISGTLTNNVGGEARAESGNRLLFDNGTVGSPHSNAGQLTLFGGVLEFAQPLNVTSTGKVTGRGTLIARGTGINNSGTVTFSAGTSDIVANITNNPTAKIIVTGGSTTTFFNPIATTVGSEIRVSANSTAVFLGDVTGGGIFTGPGTKDFEAGGGGGLMITSTLGRTIVGPVASIAATTIRDASVEIEGIATILPNGTSAATSHIGSLTLDAGATFDLNDNDLVCTATPRSSIESLVRTARNGGSWDAPGLTSSAARDNPNHSTTLGILSGQEYINVAGHTTFDDIAVSGTDVLVKYTWNGDANLSGQVDFDDYVRVDVGFNTGLTGWINGDFNYSGAVNFDDYVLIDVAFNTQSGTLGRAVRYLTGEDRTTPLDSGDSAVQKTVEHYVAFGKAYAASFVAAVPEPAAAGAATAAAFAIASSRWSRLRRRAPNQD